MNRKDNKKLKASLRKAMRAWSENEWDKEYFPVVVWGDKTDAMMAEAALAVLLGIVESQEYAVEGGFLFEE